jgi:hypothetical protein
MPLPAGDGSSRDRLARLALENAISQREIHLHASALARIVSVTFPMSNKGDRE